MISKEILNGIDKDIKEILYSYVKIKSYTNSRKEREIEEFFLNYFSNIPYFKNTDDSYGIYKIENDSLNRSVCYAFLKGIGDDTIVFIHHYDVVGAEDFKLLKEYAFKPDELRDELLKIKDSLNDDAKKDLTDDTFLFGRGVCDMKGGGSIQLALLKRYSELKDFKGNIVLIAVPDEENLSAGMLGAVKLLSQLKDKHNLNYRIMINSEPHQRKRYDEGVFSEGTVGKIMPFIYVRGALSHAGKVFEGLNPLNIMSAIVRKTELNMEFSDTVGNEAAPPPTWLYLKDGKEFYDVSMPLSIKGCFNVNTFNKRPENILKTVEEICKESFNEVVSDMNKSYEKFCVASNQPVSKLSWKTKVVNFNELYNEAVASYGNNFIVKYEEKIEELKGKLNVDASFIDCNFELVDFVYGFIDDISPRIVYGLIPPYYPNVSNIFIDLDDKIQNISRELKSFSEIEFDQKYTTEYFYTGISDLSYANITNSKELINTLESSMPFFGKLYNIPFEEIEKISMPVINIGPWGKDFHKLTERVLKEDLYVRTPHIINFAIAHILGN